MDYLTKEIQEEVEAIVNKYQGNVTESNAKQAIADLSNCKDKWVSCRHFASYTYHMIILTIGYAYYLLKDYGATISILNEGIENIEEDQKYAENVKADVYDLLGRAYCMLHDKENAIKTFRKLVYYDFFSLGHTTYPSVPLYSFRSFSEYSLADLRNNTTSLSSVFEFNDPVDTAFFPWVDDQIKKAEDCDDRLYLEAMKEAYKGIRARCFVSEKPLPTHENYNKRESYEDIPPYCNTIMWAHYADYHKGFCAVYKIPSSVATAQPDKGIAASLQEIEYVDTIPYSDHFKIKQGFFTKSKRWEYEHEVRLVYYSKNETIAHPVLSLKDTPTFKYGEPQKALQAIYLGLKASTEHRAELMDIMQNYPEVDVYEMIVSKDDIYSLEPQLVRKGIKK